MHLCRLLSFDLARRVEPFNATIGLHFSVWPVGCYTRQGSLDCLVAAMRHRDIIRSLRRGQVWIAWTSWEKRFLGKFFTFRSLHTSSQFLSPCKPGTTSRSACPNLRDRIWHHAYFGSLHPARGWSTSCL